MNVSPNVYKLKNRTQPFIHLFFGNNQVSITLPHNLGLYNLVFLVHLETQCKGNDLQS